MARFIYFFIFELITIINSLPFFKGKNRIIHFLNRQKNQLGPNLFDDQKFLTYVFKKKIGLENSANKITTLGLRASTTDYSFHSPSWEGSFNLGLTSSDLFDTYYLYKLHRENLPNLKNIIIFFSVCAPGYNLIKTSERYRSVAYNYFFQVPIRNEGDIKSYFKKHIIRECKKLKIPDSDPSYTGYEKKDYYGIQISAHDRFRTHFRENQREPDQMIWLESLLSLVSSDGRRLVVVIPPVRSDYKKILPSETLLYKKLYELESKGLEIISYFESNIFCDSDLGDVDHLNEQGSIKITENLLRIFEMRSWL